MEADNTTMQLAAVVPPDVLSQNLQALMQIINTQQQMMDQQHDWLCHSLVAFKRPKMTWEDDPDASIEAFK